MKLGHYSWIVGFYFFVEFCNAKPSADNARAAAAETNLAYDTTTTGYPYTTTGYPYTTTGYPYTTTGYPYTTTAVAADTTTTVASDTTTTTAENYPPGGCPAGWVDSLDRGCFLFHYTQATNWFEAQHECERVGGFLAEPKTYEQAMLLTSLALLEESILGVDAWWIGLSDLGHDGRWLWQHSVTDVDYTHWAPGYPTTQSGADCAIMQLGDNFSWTDKDCTQTRAAPICERLITEEGSTTTHQPDTTTTDDGYTTTTYYPDTTTTDYWYTTTWYTETTWSPDTTTTDDWWTTTSWAA